MDPNVLRLALLIHDLLRSADLEKSAGVRDLLLQLGEEVGDRAIALALIGDMPSLQEMIRNGPDQERLQACDALAKSEVSSALPILLEAATGAEQPLSVRLRALSVVATLLFRATNRDVSGILVTSDEYRDVVQRLTRLFRDKTEEVSLRESAGNAISRTLWEEVLPPLFEVAADLQEPGELRITAMCALSEIAAGLEDSDTFDTAASVLMDTLSDPQANVRMETIGTITSFHPSQLIMRYPGMLEKVCLLVSDNSPCLSCGTARTTVGRVAASALRDLQDHAAELESEIAADQEWIGALRSRLEAAELFTASGRSHSGSA